MSRNIIITGANGGLGSAVVKKFLAENYKVLAVDRSGSHLGFAEGNPLFELHAVDLTNEAACETFVQEAAALHVNIDGALLLAGGFAMGGVDTTDDAAIKKMFAINFETAYHMARPLFQHMLQKGYGRIVLVGARPALLAAAGKDMMAYALSKSLLFKLAEMFNAAAKGTNVVTSVIVPSTIDTVANRESMPDADTNNWVKPEQIAEVLEFICSEKGSTLREPIYKVYNNA